jgi:hypothetical protein
MEQKRPMSGQHTNLKRNRQEIATIELPPYPSLHPPDDAREADCAARLSQDTNF